ncbi:MAG: hypothetical protein KDJ28_01400 [Candidatus Competibacteraceae bacterium]|nr:hypothetical protein [Candidatus Competibacteraceae bacterium]
MPIKPENRKRYPDNWQEIRAATLKRAGNACEQCGVPNSIVIARGIDDDAGTFMIADTGAVHDADTGEYRGRAKGSEYCSRKMIRVVLTIAHLDHTPEHNAPENLRALCQRCHLAHDRDHHQQTAYKTRRRLLALGDLFDHA